MEQAKVVELIREERVAQNKKWGRVEGEWNSAESMKLAVLVEEIGEVVEACVVYVQGGERAYERELLRAELVQVAAVIVAWLESSWGTPTDEALRTLNHRLTLREPIEGAMWTSAVTVQLGRLARAVLEDVVADVRWALRQLFELTRGWLERMPA